MIEIVCSADAKYLPHVSAMLHSLLAHTQERPLRVWLMHGTDLPEEGVAKVKQVINAFGAQIEFLRMPESIIEGFPTTKFHYSCWYRVVLPELLTQVDRALYFDCDIIMTDDIAPLWHTDLGEKVFGAAINPLLRPMYDYVRTELGLPDFREYLNSGVLLMNMKAMREIKLVDQLRRYAMVHTENFCPEQDALSVLMKGRWLSLHPRWNVQAAMYEQPLSKLPFTKQVSRETLDHPAVVHYNGPFKPWQYLCKHPLRGLYQKHLRETPWPVKPLTGDNWRYRLIRPFSLTMQYRVLLYVRPVWRQVKQRIKSVLA